LANLAQSFPEREVAVAVRLDLSGPQGTLLSFFDAPEHEKLPRFDRVSRAGLDYHWGELVFSGVQEHADEPWYRLSVAGGVDDTVLQKGVPGSVALYSATRRTLDGRRQGGIPLGGP